MRIITLNANGLRAAKRKGLFDWLAQQSADVICIQETKAQIAQLPADALALPGYHHTFADACKKGYSGVAIYSKHQPDNMRQQIGLDWADAEGRYCQMDFGQLSIVSLYLPSGSRSDERQQRKFELMDFYHALCKQQLHSKRHWLIAGDWNIVHRAIDIKNFKANQNRSGCLPQERAWMEQLLSDGGYVDAFRVVNPHPEQYTWWSNRGRAWDNNVGWRIDYQLVTPALGQAVQQAHIYRDSRFSDHAPLIIDYHGSIDHWRSATSSAG